MNDRITREDYVEQSVQTFLRKVLFEDKAYPEDQVEMIDSFPEPGQPPLEKNLISVGYNFDTPATSIEMGSDLVSRVYTLEFWIFGMNSVYARNLANAVKFAAESDNATIPLLDIVAEGMPEIDRLIVVSASAERIAIAEPEPWQQFLWTTTVRVQDEYFSGQV